MGSLKRKYINGIGMDYLEKYSSKVMHINDLFSGYISLIKIDKVIGKITVDYEKSDIYLFNDGYKCVIFLPDNENWCASAIYNESDEIIEWYFDMTKQNSIDEQGNPFFDDLYLDVAVSPDYKITVLDEDELIEALELKNIAMSDYEMAYSTCKKIINAIIPNKDFMVSFFEKYLSWVSEV